MTAVALMVDDPADRMTLRALLEAEGHRIAPSPEEAEVLIAGSTETARAWSPRMPVLVLTPVSGVPDAVRAMEAGVFGYILLPFQPGEAAIKVARAAAQPGRAEGTASEAGPRSLAEVEEQHILDTLRRCKYNQAEAARVLGIGRNTLWRKLKRIQQRSENAGT